MTNPEVFLSRQWEHIKHIWRIRRVAGTGVSSTGEHN